MPRRLATTTRWTTCGRCVTSSWGWCPASLLLAGFLTGLAGWETVRLVLSGVALLGRRVDVHAGCVEEAWQGQAGSGSTDDHRRRGRHPPGPGRGSRDLGVPVLPRQGLEDYSLARTRHSLRALLDLVPRQATVLRDGDEVVVDPDELILGDLMVVKPAGEQARHRRRHPHRTDSLGHLGDHRRIHADRGRPLRQVYAGAINGTDILEVEVTSTADNNSLAQIVHIVEAESSRRGTDSGSPTGSRNRWYRGSSLQRP